MPRTCELPAQWLAEHEYRPLLAESFSDPESHHGTVYKAANWTFAGDAAGFSQDHTDYYLPNDRPKKLWLTPLDPHAFQRLCAKDLPDDGQQAVVVSGGARSPLSALIALKTRHAAQISCAKPARATLAPVITKTRSVRSKRFFM